MREKGNRSSLKVRFTLAMVLMSLIPGLILAVVYYRNVKDFYQDKTWTYQENTRFWDFLLPPTCFPAIQR